MNCIVKQIIIHVEQTKELHLSITMYHYKKLKSLITFKHYNVPLQKQVKTTSVPL